LGEVFHLAEICDNDLPSAKRTTGTNKPSSTAIATPMLVCSLKRILSPCHEEFTAGCFSKQQQQLLQRYH
jgi:hypothetical protein